MNRGNDIVKTALNYALGTLFELDDSGVVVREVHINGGMPRIVVDRAPPTGRPVQSITRTVDGRRTTHNVALIKGCSVEWESSLQPSTRRTAA